MRQEHKFFVLIDIGRLLGADYQPADNRPVPYRCISTSKFLKMKVVLESP